MDPVGWDWKLPIIFPESRRRKESNKTQRLQNLQNRQRPDLRPGLAACFLTFAGNVRRKHWNIVLKYLEHPFLSFAPEPPTILPMLPTLFVFNDLCCSYQSLEPAAVCDCLIEVEKAQFHMGAKSQNHQLLINKSKWSNHPSNLLSNPSSGIDLLAVCGIVLARRHTKSVGAAITAQLRN